MSFEVIVFLVALALAFDFMNGFHDAANSIATIVSTGAMRPHQAVVWAAFFNFIAFLVFGVAVATTIGKGIVEPSIVDHHVVFGALCGAILWNLITWYYGIPSSSSHALIGGLAAQRSRRAGVSTLIASGFLKTAAAIVLSPALGFLLGAVLVIAVSWTCSASRARRVDRWFRRLQYVSAALYSLGHGGNDAQKTMGIIWMLLIAAAVHRPEDPAAAVGRALVPRGDGAGDALRRLADRQDDGHADHEAASGQRLLRFGERRDHAVRRDRPGDPGLDDPHDHRLDRRRRLGAYALGGALGRRRHHRVGVALHHSVLRIPRRDRVVARRALPLTRAG